MCRTLFGLILFTSILIIPALSWAQIPDEEEFGMEQMGEEEEDDKEKIVESKIGMWNLKGNGAFLDSTFTSSSVIWAIGVVSIFCALFYSQLSI